MQEVYTERNSEISPALKFPAVDEIPYIMDLREWANKRVRDYEKNRPKLPPSKHTKSMGVMV